ncbi:MAG TPA: tetratricopeptide repeat protein [Burkholderiaceae bacterium]|jgi:predicted O-linked N-acetylglucosamine transferase (SPINDLY family)
MLNWLKKLSAPKVTKELRKEEPVKEESFNTAQIRQWISEGFTLFQAGDANRAKSLFQKALKEQPDNEDALYLLGLIASGEGKNEVAVDFVMRAIAIDSSNASFHWTLGNILNALGKTDVALINLRKSVALDPECAQSRNDLGISLYRSGKNEEAVQHLRYALRLEPSNAPGHCNLGVILQSMNLVDDAVISYKIALSLNPAYSDAENNLGSLHYAQGRLTDAVGCFRRVVEKNPWHAQAWCNLGCVLQVLGQLDEAEQCLLRAIGLHSKDFNSQSNLALVQRAKGKLEESKKNSLLALSIRESIGERIRIATLLPVVAHSSEEITVWRNHFDREITRLLGEGGALPDPLRDVGACNFNLAYHSECDRDLQEKAARLYSAVCPSLLYTAPHCLPQVRTNTRRIKIGFISKFMYNHSIGRTTRGLLANLDRDRFNVTALFVPPLVDDFISNFIRDSADNYSVLPNNLEEARKKIAEMELDILFYQDIGMDAYTYFLAYSRLAPVQCVSFGHPDTTGIPNMDYWISSENFEPEGAEAQYSEKLFILRNIGSLAYYYRPTLEHPVKKRSDFGLSDQKHIYICPQSLFKLHPDFDVMLAGILRGDVMGEVVLVEARNASWGEILRERFKKSIPDVASRIRFIPAMSPSDFLALVADSDVMLDTIYFNGMNTSLEALAMGIPVVTMPTSLQRGRHAYGMYKHIGINECIAVTPEQYVNISLRLGTDKNFHDLVKQKILGSCASLYEDMNVVHEFERFFITALESAAGR